MLLDHVNKKKLSFSNEDLLKKISDLYEKGYTLGEVAFEPEIWDTKEVSFWSLDQLFTQLSEAQKFEQKKEKYCEDIKNRNFESEQDKKDILSKIEASSDLKSLEHIYRPYKKRKKTKATVAREAGLQDFALQVQEIGKKGEDFEAGVEAEAKKFIQPALGFITYEHVLKGVQDILVEKALKDMNDLRLEVYEKVMKEAKVVIQPGEKHSEKSRYKAFLKSEPQNCKYYLNPKNYDKFPAIKKGWEDNYLKVTLDFDQKELLEKFKEAFVPHEAQGVMADLLRSAAQKTFEVHVLPSVTTEVFDEFFEASKKVYLDRLKKDYISLLLTPALGDKPVLSVYEKSETEAFLVFTSHNGEYISSTVVNPESENIIEELKSVLTDIVKSIKLGCVALPLTLKTRKLEKFFNKALEELNKKEEIPVVYSSSRGIVQFINSKEAKFGFGEEKVDNTALSAFRLAKRVQNPIFEYAEHSPQFLLDAPSFIEKEELEDELFKALSYFLCMIGLDSKKMGVGLVKNLGWFQEELTDSDDGAGLELLIQEIQSQKVNEKKDLAEVLKKSAHRYSKYFKFPYAVNLLDQVRVSLEDFPKIKDFCKDSDISLLKGPVQDLKKQMDTKWVSILGSHFFKYLKHELESPFKDPRRPYKVFGFSKNTQDLDSLEEGNLYWGVVTKFSSFGAFIDTGVGVDGLVHLSELSEDFVSDPRKVVKLDQWVLVKALKVDKEAKQLSFSKTKAQQDSSKKVSHSFKGKGKKTFKEGGKGKKGGPGGRKNKSNKQGGGKNFNKSRPPKQPFNNPFAALGDLTKD